MRQDGRGWLARTLEGQAAALHRRGRVLGLVADGREPGVVVPFGGASLVLVGPGGDLGGPAEEWFGDPAGMREHVAVLREQGLPVPPRNPDPKVVIQNERGEEPAVA